MTARKPASNQSSAEVIKFAQQESGLWLCTIHTGHERAENEMEFSNRGHSQRHAYHRASIIRKRCMHIASALTCGCESCITDNQLSVADDADCVIGSARTYQRASHAHSKAG